MALPLFSELQLQRGLTIGLPELAQLGFILLRDILRIGFECVFHASLCIIHPFLDLLLSEIVTACSLRYGGLTPVNLPDQFRLALGGPTFDIRLLCHASLHLMKRLYHV